MLERTIHSAEDSTSSLKGLVVARLVVVEVGGPVKTPTRRRPIFSAVASKLPARLLREILTELEGVGPPGPTGAPLPGAPATVGGIGPLGVPSR